MFAYLDIGFVDNAEKLYEDAPSYVKSNPRVVAAYSRLKGVRDLENEKLDQIREGGEAIWRELTKGRILFEISAEHWIGEWKEFGGNATLKVARSGEFFQVEEREGSIARRALTKTFEGIVSATIRQEDKTEGVMSLLSSGGSHGEFIILPTQEGLKIIRVANKKMISARIYTRDT